MEAAGGAGGMRWTGKERESRGKGSSQERERFISEGVPRPLDVFGQPAIPDHEQLLTVFILQVPSPYLPSSLICCPSSAIRHLFLSIVTFFDRLQSPSSFIHYHPPIHHRYLSSASLLCRYNLRNHTTDVISTPLVQILRIVQLVSSPSRPITSLHLRWEDRDDVSSSMPQGLLPLHRRIPSQR